MLFLFLAVLALAAALAYLFRDRLRTPVLALEARLVYDWRECYKWASVRLAAVFTFVMIGASEYPAIAVSAIQMWMTVPAEYRALLGPVGGAAVLGLIILSRIWQQKRPGV